MSLSVKIKNRVTLPGERLAVIEEFEAGKGVYCDGVNVRATTIGRTVFDISQRIANVAPIKSNLNIPKPGDIVIGQVESVQAGIVNVAIYFVNGLRNQSRFNGMLITRNERPSRRSGGHGARMVLCRPGDLIIARVISDENAIIHLSIDGQEYGVIHTICSLCGASVTRVNGRVKCVECGSVEYRKLSSNFGKPLLK